MTESVENKPKILVVDDSRLMRVAARKILKNDFEILEAGDGEQAWESLQESPDITLVMSDLSMPNLDGLGLLKRIRESERTDLAALPVIIVTGAEDDDGSKNTALSAGASDFITKPFESVQLLARAKAQAKQQNTQKALEQSEASKQELKQKTAIDSLTGLSNQRAFLNSVEEGLSYSMRHRTELALLLVQVDKYKVLFLRRGKPAAEEVLRRIGKVLGDGRRREDAVGRIGLDTFGMLLPSANPIGARRVAEQLREAIQDCDFTIDGEAVPVSTSFAVSCPPVHTETSAGDLIEDGQNKLRLAIQRGGNCVQYEGANQPTVPPAVKQQPPTATPAPPPTPVTADIEDVHKALQDITHGRQCERDSAALVRAVLPLLAHWNQADNGAHAQLLAQLESALGMETDAQADTPRDVTSTY